MTDQLPLWRERASTGDHEHCFCTLNTVGKPMCCKCGAVIEGALYDTPEIFVMWERMEHENRKIKAKEKKD